MNNNILSAGFQAFIKDNLHTDISSLLLKKQIFDHVTQQELVEQLEAKIKCAKKLPTWFKTANIYYPNKLNIEQTSSEVTAQYKAALVKGKSLIDLTGGLGVDCYFFSKVITQITHCEINEKLSIIVHHNYRQLKSSNIKTIAQNGIEFLTHSNEHYDWIYVDPSRRNDAKGKVFLLEDCLPNITKHIDLLFSKASNILIKTSPMLDIDNGVKALQHVKAIHIVAVKNEVKELLFVLEKNYRNDIAIKTVNLETNQPILNFKYSEKSQLGAYSQPLNYLYEPNTSILKSGGFNVVCQKFNIPKLHQHSHLYTSKNLLAFPGRSFLVLEVFPYHKKTLKKRFKRQQINITCRNFPKSVAEIRNELHIKEGGNQYLFFTTDNSDNKIAILCNKT